MLVLSRKVGDRIVVGEGATEVVFVVMEVRGGNVRIGIEAERSVNIRRGELPETGQ
jgi:carbon storage regulator CsrA